MKPSHKKIVSLTGLLTVFAANTAGMTQSAPIETESIKYCEEISSKLGEYKNKDELFNELTIKAQRKAVKQILEKELASFEPAVQDKEVFVDTLLHLVEYSEAQETSEGLLTPCVVLTDANIEKVHKDRFIPVEVGKVCSFDDGLLKEQVKEMKEDFVENFFGKKSDKGTKPASVAELLVENDKISKKFGKDLIKLVRDTPVEAAEGAVETSQCNSLKIYPIELYSLSVPYRDVEKKIEDEKQDKNKTSSLSPDELKTLADNQARWHGLDPRLFRALIEQESGWKAKVVSYKGAVGLAQLMPTTAREECGLTAKELANPHDNLACGAHYLSKNISRFNDIRLGLCAYNAGPGAVKNGQCPKYKETTNYVSNITASVGI